MRTILRNNKKGGAIAFSVVLIIVLLMVGIGFYFISTYFGGAQETKDAVNAGALNVAKKALDLTVPLGGGDEQFFADVVDNNNVSLRNINRVWGKAMFVALNAEGAKNDGGHHGSGGNSASAAHAAAMAISDKLAAKLNTPTELYTFFDQYAKANSVRMLGANASVEKLPGSDWNTSTVQRKFESNIEFVDNLPPSYSKPDLFTESLRNPKPHDAINRKFVVGYKPLKVMGEEFWNVAYPFEQHPHLLDRKYYFDNKQVPLSVDGGSWDKPVPNAFGVAGATKQSNTYNETAVSWAETNPQKVYPLQFPHGFIRVKLKANTLTFCINVPIEGFGETKDYKWELMDKHDSIPIPTGCGSVRASCYCGNEYPLGTLYNAICALPTGGGSDPLSGNAVDYMLQRVREMVPHYKKADFIAKLNLCMVSHDADDQTFYIYPNSDNTDIYVMSDSSTSLPSGCDKNANPDGTQQTLDTEFPVPMLNLATFTFTCYGDWGPYPTYSQVHAERKWKPGSGWNGGCLGELEVHRHTEAVIPTIPCPCP